MKLSINDGKGIGVAYDNGIFLSIQIGSGNYCDNYNLSREEITRDRLCPPSKTAEIACWINREEPWLQIKGDMVGGYIEVSKCFQLLTALAAVPKNFTRADVQNLIDSILPEAEST